MAVGAFAFAATAAHPALAPQSWPVIPVQPPVVRAAVADVTEVTVRHGDTLSGIAGKSCGDAADWTGIYSLNEKIIGANPDLIKPGQHLSLGCRHVRITVRQQASTDAITSSARHFYRHYAAPGTYSYAGLEGLWEQAGGPSWAASAAAAVAECESGGRSDAYNPSGASGLWQILGEVVPGNVFDPMVNAHNAVAKFEASGDTWAQWVCKP